MIGQILDMLGHQLAADELQVHNFRLLSMDLQLTIRFSRELLQKSTLMETVK